MKGQAAIEFISVYGFMLIIAALFIALIVLFAFDAQNPIKTSQCSGFDGFYCFSAQVAHNSIARNSIVFLSLGTEQSAPVNITGVNVIIENATYSGTCTPSIVTPSERMNCTVEVNRFIGGQVIGSYILSGKYCNSPLYNVTTGTCNYQNVTYTGSFSTFSSSHLNLPVDIAGYAKFSGGYVEQTSGFSWMNNANQDFSISIWINSSSPNGVVVDEYGQATPNTSWYDTWIELVGGTAYVRVWNIGCLNIGSVPDGIWTNIIMTYNGTALTGYVNGVEKGVKTGTRSVPGGSNLMYYALGSNDPTNCGSGAAFSGGMVNYQIYNRVLSSSEISSIYSAGAFSTSSTSVPEMWYKLYPGANDSAAGGNNGNVIGSVSFVKK